MIDLSAVRADTPALNERIFLDSAGSSLPPSPVLEEMFAHLRAEASIGGYRAAAQREAELRSGYPVFAELLDCAPGEIAFTESASRSWLALLDAIPLGPGDRVLISQVEYGSYVIALLRLAERAGFTVEQMPSDETGQVDVDATRAMLDERVKLVSVTHVPTNSGLISPVAAITAAAHEVGAFVLLDACQSVGQFPVRMRELGVDMITGTGRKWLRGPRGTGFLAVRQDERLWPRLIMDSAASLDGPDSYHIHSGPGAQYELFEYGVAARLGLIRAARYALELGLEAIGEAVLAKGTYLRAALGALPGVRVLDPGREQGGIVTFAVDGTPVDAVREALWQKGIVVGGGAMPDGLLDWRARGLDGCVRASPHYFTTEAELDALVHAVAALA
ncbi:aminotransferase class V-fold PLP-dependent enzyme [Sciscionella sediminilitoris]|uniref:aminotransferase class V-fold PLP-dependent enzyme n=1 Tax=Sciscionella sediminilitoris TaxID=1445613 RepID=UPI0004DFA01F|nr:aminotransferase class V-fold PLP-dependent enzyme [Sciscionella sp. SE31]